MAAKYEICVSERNITPNDRVSLRVIKEGNVFQEYDKLAYKFDWKADSGSLENTLRDRTDWKAPDKGGDYTISVKITSASKKKLPPQTVKVDITVEKIPVGRDLGIKTFKEAPASRELVDRLGYSLDALDQGMATLKQGSVRLEPSSPPLTPDMVLWSIIRNRTDAISFKKYKTFMDRVMCQDLPTNTKLKTYTLRSDMALRYRGTESYQVLKHATEAFLMQETGEFDPESADPNKKNSGEKLLQEFGSKSDDAFSDDGIAEEQRRLPRLSKNNREAKIKMLKYRDEYLECLNNEYSTLPYFDRIKSNLGNLTLKEPGESNEDCYGMLRSRVTSPLFLELIWTYWHEEGMLVQALKTINLRFQNRQGPSKSGKNALSNFALDPLRPLNNLLWGYLGDEMNRLTVVRRAYEYDHHYGISLSGRAISKLESADSRSKFLGAFHNLLHLCSVFYRDVANTMQVPDGYPMLNSLKEVHLILAEGAHNQFGDLPWTSRVEMLVEQWLLARPEIKNFLMGRTMVPYPEEWMGSIDQMKTLQGWTNTSIRQFRDMGVFGEKMLLSIRYGNWSEITNEGQARQWALYWRAEIQGYIHAYKAATGVDLASEPRDEAMMRLRNMPPSQLLVKQLRTKAS